MGITLTDVLLFGKAQSDDVDNATLVIYRRNILRWGTIGRAIEVIVKGVPPLVLPDAIQANIPSLIAYGDTEQRSTPSQYQQVNFVTNTSSTVLNTGIVFNFAKNYQMEIRCRAVGGSFYMFLSRKTQTGDNNIINGLSGSSSTLGINGNFNGTSITSGITRTVGNTLYIKMTAINGVLTLYVRDETANTEDTVTGTYTVEDVNALSWIGLWGNEVASNRVDVNADVYMAKIIEDGVTVLDYVPCLNVATAGFYDKVSGTFKTTTNLVADGNTVPTPDTPMNIVSNNGTIKVRRQSGLPLDYQKITFVRPDESINLGIKTTDNTQITTEFYREANIAQYLYFSDSGSSLTTNTTAYTTSGNGNWRFGNRAVSIPTPVTTKTIYVQNKNGVRKISPTEDFLGYSSVNSFTSATNLKTGASPSGETEGNIRYYSILVEESGVAVLNLIPVRRLSDDKVGFYNLVNGDFFEATGNVVRGGDIADPVEIYTDGTVETINVHGKNLFDKNSSLVNGYINSSGAVVSGNALKVSPFIEIKPNTTYTLSGTGDVKVLSYDRYAYTYTAEQTPIAQIPSQTGGASVTFTTAQNAKYIRIQMTPDAVNTCQLELGSTATDYQPYYNGGTATAEMLLKVGDYTDVQEILSGKVKRNVGIKVLNGTENFETATATNCYSLTTTLGTGNFSDRTIYCTHFGNTPTQPAVGDRQGLAFITNKGTDYTIAFGATTQFATQSLWKAWLAQQFANGTPVIVVYPLATTTTQTVTGQTLQVQAGDNTLEITQASIDGLELQVTYQAGVSVTIEEVEDAQLSNDVEVTIQ